MYVNLIAIGINETVAEVVQAAVESIKDGKSLWELTGNVSCGRRIFLGDLIMEAAPFLYPFLIEYSLIGAAVLYVIWTQVGSNPKYFLQQSYRNCLLILFNFCFCQGTKRKRIGLRIRFGIVNHVNYELIVWAHPKVFLLASFSWRLLFCVWSSFSSLLHSRNSIVSDSF